MKKRLIKKIRNSKYLAKRNISKAIYISIILDEYWSFSDGRRTWFIDLKGRTWLYSYVGKDKRWHYAKGYDVWHNPDDYGMLYE